MATTVPATDCLLLDNKVYQMFCFTARTSCKIKTKETNKINGIMTCMWWSHVFDQNYCVFPLKKSKNFMAYHIFPWPLYYNPRCKSSIYDQLDPCSFTQCSQILSVLDIQLELSQQITSSLFSHLFVCTCIPTCLKRLFEEMEWCSINAGCRCHGVIVIFYLQASM